MTEMITIDRTVMELAREAGWGNVVSMPHIQALERFASLVAAAEREACAKACVASDLVDMPTTVEIAIVRKCAAAIRGRSNK